MPELLDITDADPQELRLLSRSPHPYHRLNSELLEPSQAFAAVSTKSGSEGVRSRSRYPYDSHDTSLSSASGTEADDEHFLKGLPAPKRHHKGVRGLNEVSSGTSSPMPSPSTTRPDEQKYQLNANKQALPTPTPQVPTETLKRRKEVVRRLVEIAILGGLCASVLSNHDVQKVLRIWKRGRSTLSQTDPALQLC